jgi:prepilin-type N-terminal cleavage/methylation domain-containing protein
VHIVKSQAGYSMIEVLISTVLGGIVLAGVFDLYVSSQNSILGQTNAVQMQTDVKTAMDYMAKELRLMYGSPTITTTTTANDTISFVRIEDSGYSSGGNNTTNPGTLNDSSKSWIVNAFASGAYSIQIINGKGVGEVHTILSNTASTLTLSGTGWSSLAVTPDTTSLYYIIRNKAFRQQADKTLRYQIGSGANNLLASNVTALTFSQPDPMSVTVALTAQTQTVDPRTGQYASYKLSDTVRKRN